MEYGIWNLHGSIWTGNTDLVSRNRCGVFGSGTDIPVNKDQNAFWNQPEYVAMKPGSDSSRRSSITPEIGCEVSIIENEVSSQKLTNSSKSSEKNSKPIPQSSCGVNGIPEQSTNRNNVHKKQKLSKNFRNTTVAKSLNSSVNGSVLTQHFLNQDQCNPMYRIMLGQMLNKKKKPGKKDDCFDVKSDTSSEGTTKSICGKNKFSRNMKIGFECGECDVVMDTRPALKKHISERHPHPVIEQDVMERKLLLCPIKMCQFSTVERNKLESHMAIHVSEGFSPTGKKKFSPLSLQRIRYEREEYHCQLCSYTCTIEKAFFRHLKLHSLGGTPTATKISCVICGKDRPSEVEMNKHMKKHRDNRHFCCDICVFKTIQLKKLIQHRRMHTGEKPHLCPHCAYRSARRDNLRSHVRRVHKKENLFCDTFSPMNTSVESKTEKEEN